MKSRAVLTAAPGAKLLLALQTQHIPSPSSPNALRWEYLCGQFLITEHVISLTCLQVTILKGKRKSSQAQKDSHNLKHMKA